MGRDFFDTLSAQEKQRIRDRSGSLVDCLEQWARQYTSLRASRIPTAALATAVVVPRMSPSDSLSMARMILWIFGVDDRVDGHKMTPAEMRRAAMQWYLIANDGPGNGLNNDDELTRILIEMRRDLSSAHLFDPLREYWASRLRLLVLTMAREYQYGTQYNTYGPRALPSFDEYLRGGTHSIGLPFWQATALILLRDSSVLEHFEPIDEAITHAGAAARLYNDVRTLDKEIQEGGMNSVLIVYQAMLQGDLDSTGEGSLDEAKQYVLQQADSYAEKCYDLLGWIDTDSGQVEETIFRLIAFHAYYYGREYDYHITSLAEAYAMIGTDTS
jgi:hypothetical protein